MAQWIARSTSNRKVVGSNPTVGIKVLNSKFHHCLFSTWSRVRVPSLLRKGSSVGRARRFMEPVALMIGLVYHFFIFIQQKNKSQRIYNEDSIISRGFIIKGGRATVYKGYYIILFKIKVYYDLRIHIYQ